MNRIFGLLPLLFLLACKGYKDPAPFTDPRIVNPYCNNPSAINYNWNFPGIPNDSVCIFPADIFGGTYFYHDSIFNATGLLLNEDSFYITLHQIDTTHLTIEGFCTGKVFTARANRFGAFTLDSIQGSGQFLCNGIDTLMGGGSKFDIWDTLSLHLQYQVHSDTAVVYHAGTAIKQ